MIHLHPPFTVTLSLAAHQQAERLRQQQHDPRRAKQVYLNALAVYAVGFYLECLGIQTRSSLPTNHLLMDSASLTVPACGNLECRPVLPNETEVSVPAETWSDRIGYVAVQLSESLREAAILGFVPTVATERVPLTELRSLDELPRYLHDRRAPVSAPINLGEWLQGVADVTWRTVGEFLDPLLNPPQPTFGFRGDRPSAEAEEPVEPLIRRGKNVALRTESDTLPLVLLMGLLPRPTQEVDIWVQLEAAEQQQLPPSLQLRVLDDTGTEVMYAQARSTEAMQLQFTAAAGEQFGVQIRLEEQTITETFVVGLGTRS